VALTKVIGSGVQGIANASDATFLTATSSEGVTLAGTLAVTGVHTVGTNAVATSDGGAATTSIIQGLTKQWCNLDGSGTIGINDSFNVSSVTDNGTGNYGFTCTSNFSQIHHTPAGLTVAVGNFSAIDLPAQLQTTGTPQFRCFNIDASTIDSDPVTYKSCGDLA